jgi:putative transposase
VLIDSVVRFSMGDRVNIGITLTIRPRIGQIELFNRHAGARRFAFNWCVAHNRKLFETSKKDKSVRVPYSGFDHINAFNRFKLSPEAGRDARGKPGLPWRNEVNQGVFEEAAKDFAKGLHEAVQNIRERRAKMTKRKVGFPDFKSRFDDAQTFCFRNNDGKRLGVSHRGVRVPKLGVLEVREGTARLRKLLRHPGPDGQPGAIKYATIHYEDHHWRLGLSLEVDARIVASCFETEQLNATTPKTLGCDVGLATFLTVADPHGGCVKEYASPQEVLRGEKAAMKLQSRATTKRNARKERQKFAGEKHKVIGSSEKLAWARFRRCHGRQKTLRRDHLHRVTKHLLAQADVFAIESLRIPNMLKNHALARSIARQGWGEFKRQMGYKTLWSKKKLVMVDPWFPSTKRCSQCHEQKASVLLEMRIFVCDACGHIQGRDVNAAVNLAQYAQQILNASPEVPGQGKTPEPMRLERTAVVPRGRIPRKHNAPARKSDGTAKTH